MSVQLQPNANKLLSLSGETDILNAINGCNRNVMVIMRGLPGCGKTTLANKLVEKCHSGTILSTDDYFCRNGVYYYDQTLLQDAHEWNQNRAKRSVMRGVSPVIVDNTNLEDWEMSPYIEMATKYRAKYAIILVEPDTPWRRNTEELSRRNVHNIPRDKIERMREKYENNSSGGVDGVTKCMAQMNITSNNRQLNNVGQNNARLPHNSFNNRFSSSQSQQQRFGDQPQQPNTFQPRYGNRDNARFGANAMMTRAPSLHNNNQNERQTGQRMAHNNTQQKSYRFGSNSNQNKDTNRHKQFNNNQRPSHNANRFLNLSERDN